MNRFDQKWQRLTALARQAPARPAGCAPAGFATRLAANGLATPAASGWAGLGRYALRGLLAATTVGVAAVAFGGSGGDDHELGLDDPVSLELELL